MPLTSNGSKFDDNQVKERDVSDYIVALNWSIFLQLESDHWHQEMDSMIVSCYFLNVVFLTQFSYVNRK